MESSSSSLSLSPPLRRLKRLKKASALPDPTVRVSPPVHSLGSQSSYGSDGFKKGHDVSHNLLSDPTVETSPPVDSLGSRLFNGADGFKKGYDVSHNIMSDSTVEISPPVDSLGSRSFDGADGFKKGYDVSHNIMSDSMVEISPPVDSLGSRSFDGSDGFEKGHDVAHSLLSDPMVEISPPVDSLGLRSFSGADGFRKGHNVSHSLLSDPTVEILPSITPPVDLLQSQALESSNGSDGFEKGPYVSNRLRPDPTAEIFPTLSPPVDLLNSQALKYLAGSDGLDIGSGSDPRVEMFPSFLPPVDSQALESNNGSDGFEKGTYISDHNLPDPTVEILPSIMPPVDSINSQSPKSFNGSDGSEEESTPDTSNPTVEILPSITPPVDSHNSQALNYSNSLNGSEKGSTPDASDPTVEIPSSFSRGFEESEKVPKPTADIARSFSPLVYSLESQDLDSLGGSEKAPKPMAEIARSLSPIVHSSETQNLESVDGSVGSEKASAGPARPPLGLRDLEKSLDGSEKGRERRQAKRVLDFGDVEVGDNLRVSEKEENNEAGLSDNKEKIKKNKNKKRIRSGGDDDKGKSALPNKKREEKERKMYLQQLHAESQKLLRETREASFKPIPAVHKPISSVLEKIRQRKLEVMKKTAGKSNNCSFSENNAPIGEHMTYDDSENVSSAKNNNYSFSDNNDPIGEVMTKDDLENVSSAKKEADKSPKVLQDQTVPCESNSDDSLLDGLKEPSTNMDDEDYTSRMVLDEQPMHAFRAPLDDTQDLFGDSQTSEEKEDMSSDQYSYPLEEDFAPSLLAMNLKFDSAPPDDISSDDEDNDKENVKPRPTRAVYECASPKGDPVKAFVDEEAEEEDNSDNDMRFNENEEDDIEDYEELKDLIATGYEENAVDNDMRNELHQKWLEQQDATGTDDLMQRLKYGSKLKEASLFEDDDEEEDSENEEDFYDEAAKDPSKASVARTTIRKAKQMIPQLFSDKVDDYISDEEEAEKRITKQRVLDKVEKQTVLVPPAEDEKSREVFGRIKKLNIMPDTKKKAKTSSIFDKMLTGTKSNGTAFAKSSFVGRKGNHSLPSSTKKGTSTGRSFIFGRDDSNSRSSLSVSEDSSDMIIEDTQTTRNVTTKISSSQFKYSSQITKSTAETSTHGSLLKILKRSSVQSSVSTADITQDVFDVFKIPKTSLRIEQRF